ncbi:MAG TPA: hypothetical protein PKH29_12275, partial [Oscillospiraceae bacterium]|nr:hypothetical protein [Oscillospiraceae bacterium]
MPFQNKLPTQSSPTIVHRQYNGLLGIDASSDESNVGARRAARGRNMYRTYSATFGECIQTRPGFRRYSHKLGDEDDSEVYGIHIAKFYDDVTGTSTAKALIHCGTYLYLWDDLTAPVDLTDLYPIMLLGQTITGTYYEALYSGMNRRRSVSFFMAGKLWIMDGLNYLAYDGTELTDAEALATVPTTSIGRAPAGGGEEYQQVNLLTPRRRNQFSTDGAAKDYILDAVDLDTDTVFVELNGTAVTTGFSVDKALGKVTFTDAPAAASPSGTDNLVIEFFKTTAGGRERIANCTMAAVFDDRIFVSGNPNFQNYNFHCMAEDPAYFGDLSYYKIGSEEYPVTGLLQVFNTLLTLKENKVFIQTGTDSESDLMSRVYPVTGGAECAGCLTPFGACNFLDDPVFVSKMGLEGLDKLNNSAAERYVGHRSKWIDGLLSLEDKTEAYTAEYNGYLLILIDGTVYLADSRMMSGGQYEWYVWDSIGINFNDIIGGTGITFYPAKVVKVYDGDVFFGTENGYILKMNFDLTASTGELLSSAYIDDAKATAITDPAHSGTDTAITAYWAFCYDDFNKPNEYKTLTKRGNVIHSRAMPHSVVKVAYRTDKEHETSISRINTGYFDLSDMDFEDFTFNTFAETDIVFKKKVKKFKRLQIVLYSDEIAKPFGIYSLTMAATIGNYYKK